MSKGKKNAEDPSEELEDLEPTESETGEVRGGKVFPKVEIEYKPQKP